MAIVTQEQVLFSGTIKDNIALGNERASMEDIEAASKVRARSDPIHRKYEISLLLTYAIISLPTRIVSSLSYHLVT